MFVGAGPQEVFYPEGLLPEGCWGRAPKKFSTPRASGPRWGEAPKKFSTPRGVGGRFPFQATNVTSLKQKPFWAGLKNEVGDLGGGSPPFANTGHVGFLANLARPGLTALAGVCVVILGVGGGGGGQPGCVCVCVRSTTMAAEVHASPS